MKLSPVDNAGTISFNFQLYLAEQLTTFILKNIYYL